LDPYILVDIHREANVISNNRLKNILAAIFALQKHFGCDVYILKYPRFMSALSKYNLSISNPKTHVIDLVGYQRYIELQKFSNLTTSERNVFRETYHLHNHDIAIGVIGRIVKIKNLEFFIEAANEVKIRTSQNIRVFIVGDGDEKENLLRFAEIRNLEVSTNQKPAFLSFTSWNNEVHKVFAGMDIICLTSKNEGTPLSLIEAQAAAKPVRPGASY